mgnify:CR=1 FL=1
MDKILDSNKIDHIGIVVPNIKQSIKHYENIFGVTSSAIVVSEAQKVKISFIEFSNIKIELIQPLDLTSPINNFLNKNPNGGLHHLGIEVNDINKNYKIAQELNLEPIDKPSKGYHGKLLFFLHPKKMMNTLIELLSKN